MTRGPFSTLIETSDVLFNDFNFLQPGGILHIRQRYEEVTRLRIELPGPQYLSLRSIHLETSLSQDELIEATTMSSSSWHTEPIELAAILTSEDDGAESFSTGKDDTAWIELAFATPLELVAVQLRNIDGPSSRRPVGLSMTLVQQDGTAHVLYDAERRRKQLRNVARGYTKYSEVAHTAPIADLLDILVDTIAGHHARARSRYKKVRPPDEVGRLFRHEVNELLLRARGLEWTGHGAQRSFRFWSEAEKVDYIETAAEVAEALADLTPNVCFGYGAALAAVRDGEPIPHDDDLDLIVGFDADLAGSIPEALALVKEHLGRRGFDVRGEFLSHRHVVKPGHRKLDVFVGLFEGDTIAWFPGTRGALHRNDMFPPSTGRMLGVECPLPNDPVVYLETVYGPTWQVPDPAFKHRWQPKPFADQMGSAAKEDGSPAVDPVPPGPTGRSERKHGGTTSRRRRPLLPWRRAGG